jgi:hypothetical protein
MDNISSDTNYSDENNQYDEGSVSSSSESTDVPQLKEEQDDGANTKNDESQSDKDENKAEKVEDGYAIADSHSDGTKKNVLIPLKKNVPNDELVHKKKKRQYVKKEKVKELCKKKYDKNGQGITFQDIMREFSVYKWKAQRKLKYFHMQKFLITPEELTKQGIHLNGLQRKNPQRYYLMEMKAKIIESRKNNVPKDTTDTSITNQHKIQFLQDWLVGISSTLLYIHKLQIKTSIDKENYEHLDLPIKGIAKVHLEKIGQIQASHNVEYQFYTNGTIMIYITCTDNPFRLYDEQDILKIMLFLGRVDDRLKALLTDNRDKVVPSVMEWILKACDVNKDIEINDMAQLTLPDIQISLAERAFRGYVKVMNGKAYFRSENPLTPNEPIPSALENIRTSSNLDEEIHSFFGDGNRGMNL